MLSRSYNSQIFVPVFVAYTQNDKVKLSASDFEFLPHDVMLDRCYRYFYKYIPQSGSYPNFLLATYNGNDASRFMHLKKPMSSGSLTLSTNGTFVSNNPYAGSSYDNISSGPSIGDVNQSVVRIGFGIPNSKTGGTSGRLLVLNDATSFMAFEDELSE